MIKQTNKFSTTKKINLVFFATVISMTSLFSSCKEEDPDPIVTKPAIEVSSPVDGTSQVSGTTTNLSFTANSTNGLKKVVVKFKSATGLETTKFDSTLTTQPTSFTFSRNYTAGPIGTETYTIVITDKKDNIETKSVNIKSITGFAVEDFGTFFHILGSNPGAFDLVKGEQRVISDSDNDKDIVNTNSSGVFTGSWIAKNSTLFVSAPGFNYTGGTINEAKDIYAAGSPNASVSNPTNGSIYIAK